MWTAIGLSPDNQADFRSAAMELLQETSRTVILAIGGIFLIFIIATGFWPNQLGMSVWSVAPIALVTCVAAYKLLDRHFVPAQITLLMGLSGAILLGLYVSQVPQLLLFAALLPLLAAVTLGLTAALATVAGTVVLALVAINASGFPSIPPITLIYTLVGSGVTTVLGWSVTSALLTVTEWALYAFEQAREQMAEAREQRVELKEVQEDLIEANKELARISDRLRAMYQIAEEARRAKEAFVANVSHELRTPLNMIIGFSEMITQSPRVYGDNLPPALLSDIATIHENSRNLARLVNDVLDLSQVEAGRMALSKEWVSIEETIRAAALAVRPLFESKDLYLNLKIPEDLPEVFCDSTRIREVVLNLLSNAGRYTEEGGVTVSADHTAQEVSVAVQDTGPGISPEDQSKLFQPFHQLDDSLRRQHSGTGLGLSISKRFVEMHDGEMWLESEVGAGTTFCFKLPRLAPARIAVAQRDSAARWFNPYESAEFRERTRRSKAPAPDVHPRFVLVENHDRLQRLFDRYMSEFETTRVRSIDEAVTELERSPAKAMIVNAPAFGNECEIQTPLHHLPYDTPTLKCWLPSEEETTYELGLRRYLLKPITQDALLNALDEIESEDNHKISTVLLVDDEPDALRLFARMLTSDDRAYRVLRAKNGDRAMTLLRQRRPDVILLDLIMPGVDGFQVLQQKASDPEIRDIPVIAISSRDPGGQPIVSDRLTVTRSGGLSARDLLTCIRAVSEILTPTDNSDSDRSAPPLSLDNSSKAADTLGDSPPAQPADPASQGKLDG